ncbi:hypothetical protein BGZ93_001019 [Podila epicladia]|nr:hypothetical protein BGZ92_009628 [Podila epicladia]KAG0100433.1 hypothetical protein BGZ93_001019 [Podila epicladia]
MKFTHLATVAALLAVAAAQSGSADCTLCLQSAIKALPKCAGLDIIVGNFNPGESTAYAECLCSSLDGAWVDGCSGDDKCGKDILSFKTAYASNIQSAGLICSPVPTFVPSSSFPTK